MSRTYFDTCAGQARAKRAGWYHVRVRRFRRAAVTTCPNGHEASCRDHEPGAWPAYLKIDELWNTLRWATLEAAAMRDPWPRCYVTPSYSGGHGDAFVNGKLRRPMCFGTHHEAWAQPQGTRITVHGPADDLALVLDNGESWVLAAPEYA